MFYVGIDPGVSGAIAWIGNDCVPQFAYMPESERDRFDVVRAIGPDAVAVIEKMGAIPGRWDADEKVYKLKTKPSNFGVLMQNYGSCRMALIACGIPFVEVQPGLWQATFGLRRASGAAKETDAEKKRRHKAKAQQLFTTAKVTLKNVDALLLSAWCRMNAGRLFPQAADAPA